MGCCSQRCRQFMLLVWKNFKLQIRRPIGTVFELTFPLAIALFLILLKIGLPNLQTQAACFVTFDSDTLTVSIMQNYTLFYAPRNETPENLVSLIKNKLSGVGTLEGMDTEEEIMATIDAIGRNNLQPFRVGIPVEGMVFNNLEGNNIEYTLRLRHEVEAVNSWLTGSLADDPQLPEPRIRNAYLSEGFLHLQNIVSQSIVEWKSGRLLNVSVAMRQFPNPSYRQDLFLTSFDFAVPLLLMLAFIYSVGVFVKELVLEKETRIRESMFMMGLSQWVLWSTWYIKQFIFLFITVVIMSLMLKYGQIFATSDVILLIILFTLFIFSLVSFCYFISVWFDSAQVGQLVGFLAWFLNYLPLLYIRVARISLPTPVRACACILNNMCLGFGMDVLIQLELRQEGLQWNNVASPTSFADSFNMAWVFGMLAFDTILYMLLAWYINAVKPGEYGAPQPFYFPILPSYWTGKPRRSKMKDAKSLIRSDAQGYDPSAHEEEPTDLVVGISIQNLTKIYKQSFLSRLLSGSVKHYEPKVAVNGLSLNMFKGQITALLGHNGAGKTTTISILTGLYTPTSGTALIHGNDVCVDMDQIRKSLGICPQHNVLFDRLTVAEHLRFFTRLKGVWGERVNEEVEAMITDLQLLDKKNVQAGNLSGGQKRKLSVGIALIGGSEVVVLDEPTSGMDPYARRTTWDLLGKHKEGRTMLLTTHYMDEADLLGDRIAIMAEGKLRCSGSSLFLKSRYGIGYHMTLVKEPECDSDQVTRKVLSLIHEAQQVTDVGAELSFILPSSATPHFPQLFEALDARKAELGISSFGVSVTTMEEVFMKVREGTEKTLESRMSQTALLPPPPGAAGKTDVATSATIEDQDGPKPLEDMTVQEDMVEDKEEDGIMPQVKRPAIIETGQTTHGNAASLENNTGGRTTSIVFTPNRGPTLRIQQFGAMFLKRFHNSLRFYGAWFSQLIIPIAFVLIGLLVTLVIPNASQDDPRREIRLDNSALSDNITIFYAQFGDEASRPFNFTGIDASVLGATEFLDYTREVQSVINETTSSLPNSTADCCKYRHQMLDQYCATREVEDLTQQCGNIDSFGYQICMQCLSCCTSREARLRSCTNPFYQLQSIPSPSQYCPAAPQVAFSSEGNPSGKLENNNVYVAERLLTVSEDIGTPVFFEQFQAGFVVTQRDPPHSVCSCSATTDTCNFISPLQPIPGPECYYAIPSDCVSAWSLCTILGNCSDLVNSSCQNFGVVVSGVGSSTACNASLPGCYVADGFSSNVLQDAPCSNPMDLAPTCNTTIAGATYRNHTEEIAVTVWYNNEPYHMSAAALNAFHNLQLKQATGDNSLSITIYNHPFPRNVTAQANFFSTVFGGAVGTVVMFGYSFLLASSTLFLVAEKESKAKHLQFVSGLHTTSYWLANLVWDLLNAVPPILISIALFAAFQVDAYSSGEGLAAVSLLLIFTTLSGIPITYFFSSFFSNTLAAYGLLMITYFSTGVLTHTVVIRLDTEVADMLHYFFLIFPTYGMVIGFIDIYVNQITRGICTASTEALEFCASPSAQIRYVDSILTFNRPGIGITLTYMAAEAVIFFFLTMLYERSFFYPELKQLLCRSNSDDKYAAVAGMQLEGEDSDVSDERKRVLSGGTAKNEVIVIKNLVKVFSGFLRPEKRAVSGITLGIPSGECFGLLGVNGAGKTTTFSILTGDRTMTSGTAIIAGYDIRTQLRDVQQRIGYCPQFDALIEYLTGRELLTTFARIRGVPEGQIKEVVEHEITRLDLSAYADKRCGKYSGGNKRKLSTAIAIVGNPSIVFLDEPTTGMDPTTRRFLWDVLTGITHEGRSIILTSHSMEECEALCTRLAIMVNGSFRCLGGIQHLKNKYGSGYTLQAKIKLTAPPETPKRFQKKRNSIRRTILRMVSSVRTRRTSSSTDAEQSQFRSQPSDISIEEERTPDSPSRTRFSRPRPSRKEDGTPDSPSRTRFSPPRPLREEDGTPDSPSRTRFSRPRPSLRRRLSTISGFNLGGGETPSDFNPYDTTSLNIFIREAFPGALLLEEHQGAVTYQLPSADISWSTVFRQLEDNKERLSIIDYSVSQTTLEQVFLNFANKQEESHHS